MQPYSTRKDAVAAIPARTDTMTVQSHPIGDMHRRATHLLWYRTLIAVLLLGIAAYFYFQPLPPLQRLVMLAVALAFVLFAGLQWLLLRTALPMSLQLGFHFLTDLLLASGLVFATGGSESPFAFVYALIIVAAGTQATALLVLSISVAACAFYLCAVYAYLWLLAENVSPQETLSILLQVSALLLVGGVMAAAAARQERLQQDRRHAIRQHAHLEELHGQMINTMQEGVLVLGQGLVVEESNLAADLMMTGGEGSLQGRRLPELMELPAKLKQHFAKPRQFNCACEYRQGDQTYMLNVVCLRRGEDVSSWLLSIVDISELRRLEQGLAAQDKLASLGRVAAMLAHEIRNPLQTIGQAIELMPAGNKPHEQEMRSIVLEETQRLNRLLSDMLDYTRPLKPNPQPYEMAGLIKGAVRQVEMQGNYGIRWQSDCPLLRLDADHFRLLLDNLLRNAVRASPAPASVDLKLQPDGKQAWRLEITDAGGGIPEDIQQHPFEPFVTSKSGGWGLGLATVWQVCQVNGWRIEFDSNSQGTCFVVRGRNEEAPASGYGQDVAEAYSGVS